MAEKVFVIYQNNAGTATARPVLEFYTDDADHVPDLAVLGYSTSTTGWVAVDAFGVPETADPGTRTALFIDPSPKTISTSNVARYDVTHAQTKMLGKIADLIAQWKWTQELDARITKATQVAFANWINSLENIPSNSLWSTDPLAISLPATPSVTAHPDPVGKQVSAAGWFDPASIGASKLTLADFTNQVPDDQLQDPEAWVVSGTPTSAWKHSPVTGRSDVKSVGDWTWTRAGTTGDAAIRSSTFFSVDVDDTIYCSMQAIRFGGTMMNILGQVIFYDKNDAVLSSGGYATFYSYNGTANTAATRDGELKVPAGATQARFRFYIYASGTDATTIYFASPTVRRKTNGRLLVDNTIPSQKLILANSDTLQPIWGFDTDDLSPFTAPNMTKGWASGRSGSRALRLDIPGGTVATLTVRPLVGYSFAMAPGDTFYVEAWVRASASLVVNVGLAGFDVNIPGAIPYDGGDGRNEVSGNGTWMRVSGYIQVPSGNPIRWGSAEVTVGRMPSASWVEVDGLTVTRVPRLPNAYSQATDTVAVNYTGTDFAQADVLLLLNFYRGGGGATVKLNTSLRIVPQNTTTDVMRMQFWLVRAIFGTPTQEVMTTWMEYGNGAQQHRNTGMEWTDPVMDNKRVEYTLRATKLGSVNTMSVAHRSMSAILLPRL